MHDDCALPRPVGAVLVSKFPPPETWGDECRDARHFVVRSNCVLIPPLESHYPNPLGEGWGNGGPGGIRTLDTITGILP